jgi:hypothetical protein
VGQQDVSEVENKEMEQSSLQYGADLSDCVIGHFALCRTEYGVRLIKIRTRIEGKQIDGYDATLVEGIEYVCHRSNREVTCLRSTWNYHHANARITQRHVHWEVIAYFEQLSNNR